MAQQQLLGLVATFATEEGVQQVHHRPEVPALLDVHLEEVAEVVQARCGETEQALLLHGRRLGVALDDEEALQVGAVLAGHLLPRGGAHVLAKRDAPVGLTVGEEDPPPILLERDVPEVRPAVTVGADRRAQVDVPRDEVGSEVAPPLHEAGLPRLERTLQSPVAAQVDVVREFDPCSRR